MLKYAFYLPQFHQIPENDEWWGKGFTEWTNVKRAKPLFLGHKQPIHPVEENYYNLLDKTTVEWQTRLLEDYHIDGLVYYHYYFCGKKLLEKPAENLLSWKDIKQNFFFCWANHDWNRAWNGSREILMKQTYGDINDWEEHFQYLLPFFKDERYLKLNNKPAFMLFKSVFDEKMEMMSYFNKRCKEEGFDGIYVFDTYNGSPYVKIMERLSKYESDFTHKEYVREPTVSRIALWDSKSKKVKIQKTIYKYKSEHCKNKLWITKGDDILKYLCRKSEGTQYVHGLFFSFDNTPRHKMRGEIIKPVSKKAFMKAMDKLKNQEIVFFNAWNEWAEGMMMEPTEEYGDRYLSWIKEWTENNEKK